MRACRRVSSCGGEQAGVSGRGGWERVRARTGERACACACGCVRVDDCVHACVIVRARG